MNAALDEVPVQLKFLSVMVEDQDSARQAHHRRHDRARSVRGVPEAVRSRTVEDLVGKDSGLAALDRKLADDFAAAWKKAVNEHPPC